MKLPAPPTTKGWQPLTPRGVAAFACVPLKRLLLVQFLFATLAAAVVVWFLSTNWFPTIRVAIQQLPPQGEIRLGRLDWGGDSPQLLAEGHFLAFVVDLNHSGTVRSPAHIQVEFGRNSIRILSLLGYLDCGYPKVAPFAFNRPQLEPWWGAWEPPMLWISVAVTLAGLMTGWSVLATVYCPAAWGTGFFADRDLDLRGSWKLCGAALMPGALLMSAGIVFYGLEVLDVLQLTAAAGVHLLAGWFYLAVGPFFAPKRQSAAAAKHNPFAASPGVQAAGSPGKTESRGPFSAGDPPGPDQKG